LSPAPRDLPSLRGGHVGKHRWEGLPEGSDGRGRREDGGATALVTDAGAPGRRRLRAARALLEELEEEASEEAARRRRADEILARIAETLEARRRHRRRAGLGGAAGGAAGAAAGGVDPALDRVGRSEALPRGAHRGRCGTLSGFRAGVA
jgi:hypothetical protein